MITTTGIEAAGGVSSQSETSSGPGGPSEASVSGDQVEIGECKKIHVFHE